MTESTAQSASIRFSDSLSEEQDSLHPEKGPQAFRTISEVADELHVPQHVLRFWETRFEQVRPLKRGGGRRYYRPADINLLRLIADLLYQQGYTIKGVQRILAEKNIHAALSAPAPKTCTHDAEQPAKESLPIETPVTVQEFSEAEAEAEAEALEAKISKEPVVFIQTSETPMAEAAPVPSILGGASPFLSRASAEQPTGYEFVQLGHDQFHGKEIVSPEMNAWQQLAAERGQSAKLDDVISISENVIVKSGMATPSVPHVDTKVLQDNARLRHDLQDILVELEALRARLSA